MRVAIYSRYSTAMQDKTSIAGQMSNCEALAAKDGFDVADARQNVETTFDDWLFEEGPLKRKKISPTVSRFKRIYKGFRTRVELRRELRDKDGKPVKPDLNNTAHYGTSP